MGRGNKIYGRQDVERIILVMDNLNIHAISSLYKRYPAPEARRIVRKLEIHNTPRHGSWLDMAEIELNVMTRQCLARRIDSIERLRREPALWEASHNQEGGKIKSRGISQSINRAKS